MTLRNDLHNRGLLQFGPIAGAADGLKNTASGTHRLGLGNERDGLVHVPPSPGAELPLLVLLHGAGGSAAAMVPMVAEQADRLGVIVVMPESRGRTWDVIEGGYGPDVAFIDDVVARIFSTYPISPARLAIGGFSDGGSYALSLGLANGMLFGDILAFSPGFMAPSRQEGVPRVFISHGDKDRVLPIDRCGRRVANRLSEAGYDVDYREFQGGHVVPKEMVEAALERFLT